MSVLINLVGQRFGKLTVLRRAPNRKGATRWVCLCQCGQQRLVRSQDIRVGSSKSCGAKSCVINPGFKKHGKSKSEEYRIWGNMKQRCSNSRLENFKHYGGRGITVCERWLGPEGFVNFLADMGPRPPGMEINRIANDGNYTPTNCEWTTKKANSNNRRPNKPSVSSIKWSQEHISILGTMRDQDVAAIVGCCESAARNKRFTLGIQPAKRG